MINDRGFDVQSSKPNAQAASMPFSCKGCLNAYATLEPFLMLRDISEFVSNH
jgi:hypothetical protein